MTVKDIIRMAMLDIGAIAAGEVPTAQEINDGLAALNFMLSEWNGIDSGIYINREVSKALVIGQASYTVGTGGDFNVQRPERIEGAFVRDASGNDTPVKILTERREYDAIDNKTVAGTPMYVFYDATLPSGTLYAYPVPDDNTLTMYLLAPEPFVKLTSLTSDLSTLFPPGYEAAIRWNLGVELCPGYSRNPTEVHLGKAKVSRERAFGVNFARKVEPVNVSEITGLGASGGFDFLTS